MVVAVLRDLDRCPSVRIVLSVSHGLGLEGEDPEGSQHLCLRELEASDGRRIELPLEASGPV